MAGRDMIIISLEEIKRIKLAPCNIYSFVFIANVISWHKFKEGGCHVAKISSHVDEGGTYRT
jgi:hypothetical protein